VGEYGFVHFAVHPLHSSAYRIKIVALSNLDVIDLRIKL
jgi:hypothetical protein